MGIKTKLGMAMATSAAGVAMIAGGSYAVFTANDSTSTTTFTAGTLTITANQGQPWQLANTWDDGTSDTQLWKVSNLAPGDVQTETVTVKNTGSLNEWVQIQTNTSGDLFGLDSNHATYGYIVIADNQNQIVGGYGGMPMTDYNGALNGAMQPSNWGDWNNGQNGQSKPFELDSGQTATIIYAVTLPYQAGNNYQGVSGTFSTTVNAVQHAHNPSGSMNG